MKGGREVAAFTKSIFACGVVSAFRCCKIRKHKITLFVAILQKGLFFMKKFFPNLSVKDICLLGLLVAITALLSIFCTFRIGTVVKIPLKFISVFITGALYGPIFSGFVAATGDLLNCLLAPSGPIIPQITIIEFLSGFVYGLLFFKSNLSKKSYIVRTILCVGIQFLIDMFLTTALFSLWLGWYPSFTVAFGTRLVAGIIKPILHTAVLLTCRGYIEKLRRFK